MDLKGALKVIKTKHYAAVTEPQDVRKLMKAIYGYHGHTYAVAALKLSAFSSFVQMSSARQSGRMSISMRPNGGSQARR